MDGTLTAAGKNIAANAIVYDKVAIHSGDPGASGTTNEVSGGSYARQNITMGAAVDGVRTATVLPIFDMPAGSLGAFATFWAGANCVGIQRLYSDHAAAANSDSGNGTLTIKTASVHASTPTTGQLQIDGDSYNFSNRVGNVFTLDGTLTRNYAEDSNVKVPIPYDYSSGNGKLNLSSAVMSIG